MFQQHHALLTHALPSGSSSWQDPNARGWSSLGTSQRLQGQRHGLPNSPQVQVAVASATPLHPSPVCSRVSEPPWPVSLSFLVSQLQLARPLLIFST